MSPSASSSRAKTSSLSMSGRMLLSVTGRPRMTRSSGRSAPARRSSVLILLNIHFPSATIPRAVPTYGWPSAAASCRACCRALTVFSVRSYALIILSIRREKTRGIGRAVEALRDHRAVRIMKRETNALWLLPIRRHLGRSATLRHFGAEDAQRLRTRGLEVHTQLDQHLCGKSLFLSQQSEQQMLSPDITVIQLARFAHGKLEHLLCTRGIREIGPGGLTGSSLFDFRLDSRANLVEVRIEILQDGGRDALALSDESKQDMLGPDEFVVQVHSLLSRHGEDLPHPLGEVVAVHVPPLLTLYA